MVLHREVDLLVSAAVGALEQLERLIINTLRLVVRKLNRLSTAVIIKLQLNFNQIRQRQKNSTTLRDRDGYDP